MSHSLYVSIMDQWRALLIVVPQADHFESSGNHHPECCHSLKVKDLIVHQTSNEILCPKNDSHYFS